MSTEHTAAQKKALRKKLIRLAFEHPDKRDQAMAMVAKLAKLPPEFLENIQKKKDEAKGKKDDDKKDDKKPDFLKDKEAAAAKVAVSKDTEDFVRWVMSTQTPMSAKEVETFVTRTLGIKTSPPVRRRTGARFQRGDSVLVKARKHKSPKFDRGNYDLYDGKVGTVVEADNVDAMVSFDGKPAVRFPGAQSARGVGIYKYTKPYTVTGSAKIEMIYNAGGKSTPDAQIVVDAYLGKARGTEKRSANYYTGHVVMASVGGNGWYFRGFPQQRMEVDPQSEAGYQARTFNPALGQVLYVGIFNSRPAKWKDELAKLDKAAEDQAA